MLISDEISGIQAHSLDLGILIPGSYRVDGILLRLNDFIQVFRYCNYYKQAKIEEN